MYGIGKTWKIEIEKNGKSFFYTGVIIEENNSQIKIKTKFDEEMIISIKSIVQALLMNSIGDKYDRGKKQDKKII